MTISASAISKIITAKTGWRTVTFQVTQDDGIIYSYHTAHGWRNVPEQIVREAYYTLGRSGQSANDIIFNGLRG